MIYEQITDHQGEAFTPNRIQHQLYRAGWRMIERQKQGCVWIVRWVHPKTEKIYNQENAYCVLRQEAKRCVVEED